MLLNCSLGLKRASSVKFNLNLKGNLITEVRVWDEKVKCTSDYQLRAYTADFKSELKI